jgi:ubiquitin-protein ligase E3 C
MFPTFTGSSRRPRNVNLSGQNINPFAAASWTPNASSGASKTVSNAQADRQQRQLERRRLKAAGDIQRTWRGHRARRELRKLRRQEFDSLYEQPVLGNSNNRIAEAFSLLLSIVGTKRAEDFSRIVLFARDVDSTDLQPIAGFHISRLERFVYILVQALEDAVSQRYGCSPGVVLTTLAIASSCKLKRSANRSYGHRQGEDIELLMHLTTRMVTAAPPTLKKSLGRYYKVLAELGKTSNLTKETAGTLSAAVVQPLAVESPNCMLPSSVLHMQ